VIPLLLLGFASIEMVRMLSRPSGIQQAAENAVTPRRVLIPGIAVAVLLALATAWAATQRPMDPSAYVVRIEKRIEEYDVVRYRGPGIQPGSKVWLARSLRQPGVAHPIANATTISLVWIAVSSLAAALAALRVSSRRA
jgi:hypothetical protein